MKWKWEEESGKSEGRMTSKKKNKTYDVGSKSTTETVLTGMDI